MNIDFTQLLCSALDKTLVQPRRSQIYVGFRCFQRCGFCYYKNHCSDDMFTLEFIKQQIDFKYEYGIRDFEITGGEPALHSQLRDICEYIKQKDATSKIAIITNGDLHRCDIFDLIDEVLVSYHLGRSNLHYDKRIFPCGNTYNKVHDTICKAKQNNVLVRMNVVVGTFNLSQLDAVIDDICDFEPAIVNFLPVNLFDDALGMEDYIDYYQLRPVLKQQIDAIRSKLPNTLVFVRYMPFCGMEGYEDVVVGNLQHIFDWFDWNRELDGPQFLDLIRNGAHTKWLNTHKLSVQSSIQSVIEQRRHLYSKPSKCLQCKYFAICDGVEKTQQNILYKYVVPVHGKLETDFMMHMRHKTYDLYKNIYQ